MPIGKKSDNLRWGLSTGTYLAALCCAAYQNYRKKSDDLTVQLLFPDGKLRPVELLSVENNRATAVKDGGDDPDSTNGATITVTLTESAEEDSRDYTESHNRGIYKLHGTGGVGLCTRKGLPCEMGKWAINPVPRQMVHDNLLRLGFGEIEESIRFEITVVNGEEIAKKTLNPRLGIIGGISILGTTGLVRPYSHEAYIDTIRMLVKGATESGLEELLFSTGTRTARTARSRYPHLIDNQIILIGDYIQDALRSAEENGIAKVYIACMPGKLSKYAAGYANTHAHKNEQNLAYLRKIVQELFSQVEVIADDCPSVREALYSFSEDDQKTILNRLKLIAHGELQKHAPKLDISILLCDFNGGIIHE